MKTMREALVVVAIFAVATGTVRLVLGEANPAKILTGRSAFISSVTVQPGIFRKITPADLPQPFATESASTRSKIVARPAGAMYRRRLRGSTWGFLRTNW